MAKSNSRTVSTREELLYRPQDFRNLKKGEFIGFTADCSHVSFKGRVVASEQAKSETKTVKNVSEEDLMEGFKRVIAEVKFLFE